MSSFQEKVYRIVALVPKGKVTTYAAVARAIGNPRAVRAVGNALNKNPDIIRTPCRRVVRSDGGVGGYASGAKEKARLLRAEGVVIEKGKADLARFGWRI